MKTDIKVPSVGESITEAMISKWTKKSGEAVKRNEILFILETDKATVEVVAEQDGILTIQTQAGQVVPIGTVVGSMDSEGKATAVGVSASEQPTKATPPLAVSAPSERPSLAVAPAAVGAQSPAVRKIAAENNLEPANIQGTGRGGRVTKADALGAIQNGSSGPTGDAPTTAPGVIKAPTSVIPMGKSDTQFGARKVPMSMIRRRIAERLKEAQNTAAILTTFNEIDMSAAMALRAKYKDAFKEKYGINLGFMGLFVKACIEALKKFPEVNASIDGTDIVYHDYYNIGVAVSTERGLLVPVVRNTELLSLAQIELGIRDYALKARDGKISVDDLANGTFTISNGGVFGSLMSTPILNPPQSGILGMHKIEERPVAIQGKVEIRPMMYVALSYDHRVIDGATSVGFLVKVKEGIEDPARLLLEI